jgi:hypothetical protein
MGAFFFVRSLLTFVNNEAPFAGNTNGWILTGFFFFDAWLLGKLSAGTLLRLLADGADSYLLLLVLQGGTSLPCPIINQCPLAALVVLPVGLKGCCCGQSGWQMHPPCNLPCSLLLCKPAPTQPSLYSCPPIAAVIPAAAVISAAAPQVLPCSAWATAV